MTTEHNIEQRLRELESEKFGLAYAWLRGKGRTSWSNYEFREAEKATAGRRREILDEQKMLRAQRAELLAARRAERVAATTASRARRQAERDAKTAECQVCEGRQCLTKDGRMVHHGYRRPGYGSIEGDCYGVGHLPFPATNALAGYMTAVRCEAEAVAVEIAGLGERTEIAKTDSWTRRVTVIRKLEVTEQAWARELRTLRSKLDGEARWFAYELRRVAARIEAAAKVTAA